MTDSKDQRLLSDEVVIDIWERFDSEKPIPLADMLRIICEAQDKHTAEILEARHKQEIVSLWDEVICPMCYRLNPQHADMDDGKGCHWCQDREDWGGCA